MISCRILLIMRLFLLYFLILSCISAKYFYVYEWPKELHDVYPPKGASLVSDSTYDHSFNDNNGTGKLLLPEIGLFQTWQFSLYKNIMSRLLVSKHRTRDPSKATAFVIPFDAGVHSYIDHKNGKYRLASPHGWKAISLLQEATINQTFWKNYGHDHFILFSITVYHMTGIGVKTMFQDICANCSAITVESTPTFTATTYHRSRKYWFTAPYPSSFHYIEGMKKFPWTVNADATTSRPILSLFIGSVTTSNILHNALRKTLQVQCEKEPACVWHSTLHACNGVINSTTQMQQFLSAQYCPAPPGDSITRKSLFDAIVAGCIPVIFVKASLTQYAWFLNASEIDEISVYIPLNSVIEGGVNYIEVPKEITVEELRKKQLALQRIAPRLQYSVVPQNVKGNWDPPFKDAVDVIIEKMLDFQTQPMSGFTDEQLVNQKCVANDMMLNHPQYSSLDYIKPMLRVPNYPNKMLKKCDAYVRRPYNNSAMSVNW